MFLEQCIVLEYRYYFRVCKELLFPIIISISQEGNGISEGLYDKLEVELLPESGLSASVQFKQRGP